MTHETFKAPELEQLAKMLPAYDFESFIAQGGMGAVYKARQRSLDREVAIKILPRELGEDPEFRESFETEAKAMAKLNHPNLLGVYDFGDIDGMPYIVMEFVDGKTLYHSAWNKIIEPQQAIEIVKGICDGLGHAHGNGILHRDIKPANILLTPRAEPKIGDFGLAQHTDAAGTGEVMGTPGYAAPELIHSPEQAGIGTDIYAVGIILHELITGQRPDPNGIEAPKPFGDRALDAIWQKATHPQITSRYQSTAEMAAALTAWRPTTRRLATGADPSIAKPKPLLVTPQNQGQPRPNTPQAGRTLGTSPKSTPLPVSTGDNWSLARNIAIIAFLIAVIGFGYKMLQRAKQNTGEVGTPKVDERQAIPESPTIPQTPLTPNNDPAPAAELGSSTPSPENPTPPAPPIEESTSESLARLKDNLAQGRRDELPVGSQRRGTNDYLFVESPMSWYAAQLFAEEHGAHLAILESSEVLSWLSQLVPDDQNAWIGSGRSERKVWTDNDGTDWDLDDEPKGVGPFATLSDLGILRAGKATETKPFLLQWNRDGSNNATLITILERTKQTLDSPNPIYPPATVSLGARQILLLPIAMKRSQAEALAAKAGGTLAVPSSREEISWMADEAQDLPPSPALWLGGQRKNNQWTWDTGEAWENTAWIDGTEPETNGDALILIPGKGWSNADPSSSNAGLAIEWSRDAASAN